MANLPPIQLKRSTVSGRLPTDSDIVVGELALNLSDGKLYTRDHNDEIIAVGGSGSVLTVDSEQVLYGLDSDKYRTKEIVIFDRKENRMIAWDSEQDSYKTIGAAGGIDVSQSSTPPSTKSTGAPLEPGDLWQNTDDAAPYNLLNIWRVDSDGNGAWLGTSVINGGGIYTATNAWEVNRAGVGSTIHVLNNTTMVVERETALRASDTFNQQGTVANFTWNNAATGGTTTSRVRFTASSANTGWDDIWYNSIGNSNSMWMASGTGNATATLTWETNTPPVTELYAQSRQLSSDTSDNLDYYATMSVRINFVDGTNETVNASVTPPSEDPSLQPASYSATFNAASKDVLSIVLSVSNWTNFAGTVNHWTGLKNLRFGFYDQSLMANGLYLKTSGTYSPANDLTRIA